MLCVKEIWIKPQAKSRRELTYIHEQTHTHTYSLTDSLTHTYCTVPAVHLHIRNSWWCKYLLKAVSSGIQGIFPCKISFWRPAEGSSQNIFITLQSRREHWHRVHFPALHSREVLRALGSPLSALGLASLAHLEVNGEDESDVVAGSSPFVRFILSLFLVLVCHF